MATENQQAADAPKTTQEIAELLFISPETLAPEPEAEVEDQDVPPEGDFEDEGDDPDLAAQGEDLEDEEELGDDQDVPDEDDLDEADYLDVTDDDVIEVKVDGKSVEVSLGELKRAYSGEGAIEQRLQEATEERKAAKAERAQALDELETARANLVTTVNALAENMFQPMVAQPDPKLRQTDPQEYLLQQDAYEQDQRRIASQKRQMNQLLQEQVRDRQDNLAAYQKEQQKQLFRDLPILSDKEKGRQAAEEIQQTAMELGFAPQEIAKAADSRLFVMAWEAAQYRKMKNKLNKKGGKPLENAGETVQKKLQKPRRLKAGGAGKARAQARRQAQESQNAAQAARQTGKTADIAAYLRTPKTQTRKRGRNGR